jgi:hypothetical protein
LKRYWRGVVAGGAVLCARGSDCKHAVHGVAGLIAPVDKWDLGHPDGVSAGGPEHRECNRAAGGRNSLRARHRRVSLIL